MLSPTPVTRGAGMACGKGCKQVTFRNNPLAYEVKDNLLVYVDIGQNVNLVDLSKDSEWLVHARPPTNRPGCFVPSTDGTRIAYSCINWPNDSDPSFITPLQIYDPSTKTETDLRCLELVVDRSSTPEDLTLGSTGIALTLSLTAGNQLDAYFYRFSDGSFKNLTNQFGGVWFTNISGERLVWTQIVPSLKQMQIVLDDMTKGTQAPIDPNGGGGQFYGRIEGDKIVWVDHRNAPGDMWNQGNSDIYLHDLSTAKTVPVTTHPATQSFPDVWGDWVVWEDYRNNPDPNPPIPGPASNIDIYARNMKTGEEVQVTSFPGLEIRPRVDNGRVFFEMDTDKAPWGAIFMIDLKERFGR